MKFRRIGSKIRFAIICVTLISAILIGSVIAWNVNKSIAKEGVSTAELIVINHTKEFNIYSKNSPSSKPSLLMK